MADTRTSASQADGDGPVVLGATGSLHQRLEAGLRDAIRSGRLQAGHLLPSTRGLAADLGLRTASKPDSQEICFVKGGDLPTYIDDHLPEASAPGPILSDSGEIVGRHSGVGRYTIGQRRGLGVSLGVPVYVTSIDAESNSLSVGQEDDLDVGGLAGEEVSFVGDVPGMGTPVLVQHRAHGEVHPGAVEAVAPDRVVVTYEQPVKAVAPGQSAAFYSCSDPDELLGGCVIAETFPAPVSAPLSRI